MIRGFFAFILFVLFSVLIIPGILVTGFLAPFLDKGNLQNKVFPASYELVMTAIEQRGDLNPTGVKSLDIRPYLSKETYSEILSEGVNDFYNSLDAASLGVVKEINIKNTKTKFIAAIQKALNSALTCGEGGEGLSLDIQGLQCIPKNISQKEKDKLISKITSDFDANIHPRFVIPDAKVSMYLGILSDVLKNLLLIEILLIGVPVLLFILLGLLIYKPRAKILKGLGKVSLSISFETFAIFMGLSSVPDLLTRTAQMPQKGISFVKFLLDFPAYRFEVMSIISAVIGIGLFIIYRYFFKENEIKNEHSNKPVVIRNGKVRKGSMAS